MAGQGYNSSIGNSVTQQPSPTTFAAYSLLAGSNTILQWPTDNFPGNSNVVANINLLSPLGSGCTVEMPNASNRALGEVGIFLNAGGPTYTIIDSAGATLIPVPSGQAIYLCLINNFTAEGTWVGFTFGAGIAVTNAASLAGPGLAASSTMLQQIMSVFTITTDYIVTTADRDTLLNWNGGSGTITLPLAGSVGNNFYIQVRNSGNSSITIQPSGSDEINELTNLTMNVNDSAFIVCDGTNWFTLGLGIINTNIFNFQTINVGGLSGLYTLPPAQQNKVAYRFTGVLAGNLAIQVPNTIQQYWVDNETTGGFLLGLGTATQITGTQQVNVTAGAAAILYCDGVNVISADTSGLSVPIAINQGGTGAITASAALTNLGGTSLGVNLFEVANQTTAQSLLQVLSASDAAAFAWIF